MIEQNTSPKNDKKTKNEDLEKSFYEHISKYQTSTQAVEDDNIDINKICDDFLDTVVETASVEASDDTIGRFETFDITLSSNEISSEKEKPAVKDPNLLIAEQKIIVLEAKIREKDLHLDEVKEELDDGKRVIRELKEEVSDKKVLLELNEIQIGKYTRVIINMSNALKANGITNTKKDTNADALVKTLGEENKVLSTKLKKNLETLKIKNTELKEAEEGKRILAKNLGDSRQRLDENLGKIGKCEAENVRIRKQAEFWEEIAQSKDIQKENKPKEADKEATNKVDTLVASLAALPDLLQSSYTCLM